MNPKSMVNRMIRAAKLDVTFYGEVRKDTSLDVEALLVVVLASMIGGIGNGILVTGGQGGWRTQFSLISMMLGFLLGILGYYATTYLMFWIGRDLFGSRAQYGALKRALGYAYAPTLLGIIPCIGLIGVLWSIVACFVAARTALGLDSRNTALTIAASCLVWFVGLAVLALSAMTVVVWQERLTGF